MDKPGSPVNETMYRGIIGSFLYLTVSKLDIVFRHNFDLVGYADADHVGYLVDRKSISGMEHFLGSCLISWCIKKQNIVALSTIEDEYVDVASCCAQLL
ncbi:secreted RxLR effector protein 161-like [Nicotiana tabacum]|uniref:Secreted RxLR effector protein 161-like n=1 Tax=Nicotiana tabacum TaxID=4097 RepID=A0AC58TCX4_TOBAC